MPNIGAKYGRKATWIGASGDQTFLRIDEALINSHVLATSEIFASKHIIGLVPSFVSESPPFKCLLINKMDGSCRTFNDSEQEELQGFGLCLDPVYDVIWRSVQGPCNNYLTFKKNCKLTIPSCLVSLHISIVWNGTIFLLFPLALFILRFLPATREMLCYNAVIADARMSSATDLQARCSILSPELALPSGSHATTTRSHGALHILGNPASQSLTVHHCIIISKI